MENERNGDLFGQAGMYRAEKLTVSIRAAEVAGRVIAYKDAIRASIDLSQRELNSDGQ